MQVLLNTVSIIFLFSVLLLGRGISVLIYRKLIIEYINASEFEKALTVSERLKRRMWFSSYFKKSALYFSVLCFLLDDKDNCAEYYSRVNTTNRKIRLLKDYYGVLMSAADGDAAAAEKYLADYEAVSGTKHESEKRRLQVFAKYCEDSAVNIDAQTSDAARPLERALISLMLRNRGGEKL